MELWQLRNLIELIAVLKKLTPNHCGITFINQDAQAWEGFSILDFGCRAPPNHARFRSCFHKSPLVCFVMRFPQNDQIQERSSIHFNTAIVMFVHDN